MNRIKTHSDSQLLPLQEIKPGSLVIVAKDPSTIARRVGDAQGGTWGKVLKSTHTGQGKITILVKHDRAAHPTGLQQFELDATERYVGKRAL